jgi:hypothetical protein
MDATIRREDKSASSSTKPPPKRKNTHSLETTTTSENSDDGLEFLNQPPPDLTGLNGKTFAVAKDVNLTAPILLDILAEKAPNNFNAPVNTRTQPIVAPAPGGSAVAPKASEWDEW